jgi:hypothetical protein
MSFGLVVVPVWKGSSQIIDRFAMFHLKESDRIQPQGYPHSPGRLQKGDKLPLRQLARRKTCLLVDCLSKNNTKWLWGKVRSFWGYDHVWKFESTFQTVKFWCYSVSHKDSSHKDASHNNISHQDISHNVTFLINNIIHNDTFHNSKTRRRFS